MAQHPLRAWNIFLGMFEDQEIGNVQIAFRRIRFEAGDIIQARDEML
jgi:hypothetical protein